MSKKLLNAPDQKIIVDISGAAGIGGLHKKIITQTAKDTKIPIKYIDIDNVMSTEVRKKLNDGFGKLRTTMGSYERGSVV